MCKESFDVVGLRDERTAYEVEQYLSGLPPVDNATADMIENRVTIEYDETRTTQEHVLDQIELAGCKPSERIDGIVDQLKTKITF